ncbi:Dynein light chain type 1 [Pseudoloma neurophilia]|uniref:Dynein light chain type 1 n=1 Tax=Pseudoloma neurophilia TaxID=146866 RepID=A0A0R0LY70_9MICR|nr:Dynein light chain type 1 [Pseudoloma neurophilia]
MATKLESSTSVNSLNEKKDPKSQKEEQKPEHLAKIDGASCNNDIVEFIQDMIDKEKLTDSSPKFCKKLKKALDKNFGKEWNVFLGGHFCGSVGAVENGYIELTINKTLKVVAFRSYMG